MSEEMKALCSQHPDLLTALDAQPLEVVEWLATAFPVLLDNGKIIATDEATAIATRPVKPSLIFDAIASEAGHNLVAVFDTCPLLVEDTAKLQATPATPEARLKANGAFITMILNYLKSLGFGSGKIAAIIPQIVAFITSLSSGGASIVTIITGVMNLIEQLLKPAPATT